jgi:hypothetical protein
MSSPLKVTRKLMRAPFPETVKQYDYNVSCVDYEGLLMSTYCYETKGNPTALLFFLPGYGDYAKYYGYFFKKFAEKHSIRTYAMDRRGFGESQGKRGDVLGHEMITDDHF